MSIKDAVGRLLGRTEPPHAGDEPEESPSHVCRSCGEEYFTDPDIEIDNCRSCGGVKIEQVEGARA